MSLRLKWRRWPRLAILFVPIIAGCAMVASPAPPPGPRLTVLMGVSPDGSVAVVCSLSELSSVERMAPRGDHLLVMGVESSGTRRILLRASAGGAATPVGRVEGFGGAPSLLVGGSEIFLVGEDRSTNGVRVTVFRPSESSEPVSMVIETALPARSVCGSLVGSDGLRIGYTQGEAVVVCAYQFVWPARLALRWTAEFPIPNVDVFGLSHVVADQRSTYASLWTSPALGPAESFVRTVSGVGDAVQETGGFALDGQLESFGDSNCIPLLPAGAEGGVFIGRSRAAHSRRWDGSVSRVSLDGRVAWKVELPGLHVDGIAQAGPDHLWVWGFLSGSPRVWRAVVVTARGRLALEVDVGPSEGRHPVVSEAGASLNGVLYLAATVRP